MKGRSLLKMIENLQKTLFILYRSTGNFQYNEEGMLGQAERDQEMGKEE